MRPEAALLRLGGVSTTEQLLILTSRRRLRTAVVAGSVVRVGRGRYALPAAEDGVRVAAQLSGVASHLSAAAHWGWALKTPPEHPWVTVPRKRKVAAVRRTDVRVLWRDLSPAARDGWVTTRVQTVLGRRQCVATPADPDDGAGDDCRTQPPARGESEELLCRAHTAEADERSLGTHHSSLAEETSGCVASPQAARTGINPWEPAAKGALVLDCLSDGPPEEGASEVAGGLAHRLEHRRQLPQLRLGERAQPELRAHQVGRRRLHR